MINLLPLGFKVSYVCMYVYISVLFMHLLFFLERTFSVSCRVPILAKARSRVRAGSAQQQAARPVWVGEVKDFIQGRRIGVCWSRHGPGTS